MANYSEELIGQWVWRPGSKGHSVESVVNGELVTNCGRRLRRDGYRLFSEAHRYPVFCSQCEGAGPTILLGSF